MCCRRGYLLRLLILLSDALGRQLPRPTSQKMEARSSNSNSPGRRRSKYTMRTLSAASSPTNFRTSIPKASYMAAPKRWPRFPTAPGKNILSELDPHVFGDFGYIRGLATLVDGQGKTNARVRFTDIYVYRDQRWLAVAGQESLLSDRSEINHARRGTTRKPRPRDA